MALRQRLLCCLVIAAFLFTLTVEAKRPRKKNTKKKPTETSFLNFLRLFVLRLIYGFATMLGAEDGISEFMGGALVPPGVQDSDYRDYADEEDIDY